MAKYLGFTCLCLLLSLKAYAFKFSPMSTSIDLDDKKKSTQFYLENDTNQPIAIIVKAMTREMDQKGLEINKDVKDEISVYPNQMIIPPNEKRSVKVSWLGKDLLEKEGAYRLVAEQLPIELEKGKKDKANIKVLLRYVAALYINNSKTIPKIELKKIEQTDKSISLIVENLGTRHQVLFNASLYVMNEKGKKEMTIKADDLKGLSGENVLAGKTRVFTFAKTGKFKNITPNTKVIIDFEKE